MGDKPYVAKRVKGKQKKKARVVAGFQRGEEMLTGTGEFLRRQQSQGVLSRRIR